MRFRCSVPCSFLTHVERYQNVDWNANDRGSFVVTAQILTIVLVLAACTSPINAEEDRAQFHVEQRALTLAANASSQQEWDLTKIGMLLNDVRRSYPELVHVDIRLRTFNSDSDFLRTRIDISHYFSFRSMRYYIEVNSELFSLHAPNEAVRAILAHELEHVLWLARRNRISLLSLVRLASQGYRMRFERGADLRAIVRGFGPGLVSYRKWLYANINLKHLAEKRRDYFSPEEIEAIESIRKNRPQAVDYWLRHVPRNLKEIQKQSDSASPETIRKINFTHDPGQASIDDYCPLLERR